MVDSGTALVSCLIVDPRNVPLTSSGRGLENPEDHFLFLAENYESGGSSSLASFLHRCKTYKDEWPSKQTCLRILPMFPEET